MIGKLDLADPERAAPAREAQPSQEKSGQLPERVEAEASRHDRVALEMTTEKPQFGIDVELGHDRAFAMRPAGFGDFRNSVEHQHRRQRQLGVSGPEQFAATAGEEIFVSELGAPL